MMSSRRVFSLLTVFIMVLTMIPHTAFAEEAVSYVDRWWDEGSKTVTQETKECYDYTVLTNEDRFTLGEEGKDTWYVVNQNVTWDESNTEVVGGVPQVYRKVYGNVNIILCDDCKLDLGDQGIVAQDNSSITIYGQENDSGVLEVKTASGAYTNWPSIGLIGKSGAITINGGTINVGPQGRSAGIGNFSDGDDNSPGEGGGTVTINGGIVNAVSTFRSGGGGAMIGGATDDADPCKVVINGGRVTATSYDGSAIGGATEQGGDVTINGGIVNATTGEKCSSAAIGGNGEYEKGSTFVTINGGEVKATTEYKGAGIGEGSGSSAVGSKITITGGIITATGSDYAAGIGGGGWSSSTKVDIEITGGNVKASKANPDAAEIGVGKGNNATKFTLTDGAGSDVVKNEIELIGLKEKVEVVGITGEGIEDYNYDDVNVILEGEGADASAKLYFYFKEGCVADTVTVEKTNGEKVLYYRDAVARYYDHRPHEWEYEVKDGKLTATCTDDDQCHGGTVSLKEPENFVYTSGEIKAEIVFDSDRYFERLMDQDKINSIKAIYYSVDETTNNETLLGTGKYPTEVGKYKAVLEFDEQRYDGCFVTYDITPKSIEGATIAFKDSTVEFVFNGKDQLPEIIVKDGDKTLKADTDYVVSYYNKDNLGDSIDEAINVGAYLVVVTGKGNYGEENSKEFSIKQAANSWSSDPSVQGWTFEESSSGKIDKGTPKFGAEVGVTVEYAGADIDGEAYGPSEATPKYAGEYTATFKVDGTSDYKELTKSLTFNINPRKNQDGTGTYSGKEENVYIPVDTDGDGADEFIKVEKNGDITYVDDDGNKYIPIGDGKDVGAEPDKFVEVEENGEGIYKDDEGNTYIAVDREGDGNVDIGVEAELNDDGYYIDNDGNKYIPVDMDGEGKINHYIPDGVLKDEDKDGIYTPDGKTEPEYVGIDGDDEDTEPDRFVKVTDEDDDGEPDNRYIPDQDGDEKPEPESDKEPDIFEGTDPVEDKEYVVDPDKDDPYVEVEKNDEEGVYEEVDDDGNVPEDGDKYIPDQDGDGLAEKDDDGDGEPDNRYILDQDGDGIPEKDDNGDGIFDGSKDEDKDGEPDNRYIPDQDGDKKPEPESDTEAGIFEGSDPDKDKDYVVDPDKVIDPDKDDPYVEVEKTDEEGVYEEVDDNGKIPEDGSKYIPDQDGDGIAEKDDNDDGIFDGSKDEDKDGEPDNRYIPDQDGDKKPEPESDTEPGIYEGTKDKDNNGNPDHKYAPDSDGNVEEVTGPDKDGIYDGTRDEDGDGKPDNRYIQDQNGDGIPEKYYDGVAYYFLDDELTWTLGTKKDLTFTVSGPAEEFSKLIIGGSEVSPDEYDYVSGSTVITLKADYLNNLEVGNYDVEAVYTETKAATTLRVKKGVGSGNGAGSGDGTDSGDDNNMIPWLLVMMTALTAGGVTVLGRKYRRN